MKKDNYIVKFVFRDSYNEFFEIKLNDKNFKIFKF